MSGSGGWGCISRVVDGTLGAVHPTVVSESLHPAAGFVFAIPAAIFFRVGCNRGGCSGTLLLLSSRLIVGMVGNGYRVVLVPPCVGSKVSSVDNR